MKKSMIVVAVVSFATSMFGLEPSELVKIFRAIATNEAAFQELEKVVQEDENAVWDALSRMNWEELLMMYGAVDSVSSASTGLTVTFRAGGLEVNHNGVTRDSAEYVKNNETLVLLPGQGASLNGRFHGTLYISPVAFMNKKRDSGSVSTRVVLAVRRTMSPTSL